MTLACRLVLALSVFTTCAVVQRAWADEGMWPLNRFPGGRLLPQYGFTPSPTWLDQVRFASVRLAGGCSGSLVSDTGLLMTNYHSVVSCVQALTTPTQNLLEAGSPHPPPQTSGLALAWR